MSQQTIDEDAEELAARLRAEADEHERQADLSGDRFQSAALRGVAEDLRARAAQTLSETEVGRRYAREQAERASMLADAQDAYDEAAERYRQLACRVPALVDAACAEVLAIAHRMRDAAAELDGAAAAAEGAARNAANLGIASITVPNYLESALRDLMAGAPSRSRVWNASRRSTAAAGVAIAERVSELANAEMRTARRR
jgi:hypothetical protein